MKNYWLSMLLLAVLGIGLMSVGFFSGASTSLYIDRAGLHIGNESISQSTAATAAPIETITDIEIDVGAANIEIISSDTYNLEITCRESSPITYTNDNGKLRIKQNTRGAWQFFNFDTSEDKITIHYPANQSLGDIKLSTGSGKIRIDDVSCQNLHLSVASGHTDITRVDARAISIEGASGNINLTDSQTDQFDFTLASGSLTATEFLSNGLKMHIASGNVLLDGRFLGENKISIVSGTLDMRLDGEEPEYSRDVSVISGTVTVNGVKNHESVSSSAPNSLHVSLTSGNANIRFDR